MDPLAEVKLYKTPYNYLSKNPLNRVDPTGMLAHEYDKDGNKNSDLVGNNIDLHHQKNGTVKITDRKSSNHTYIRKKSDVIQNFEHWDKREDWRRIYNEFKLGNGPKKSLKDENPPMTWEIKYSQAASVASELFIENRGKRL